jgi:ATP phosphoribosyltransferase regulatory subunit HisZ
MVSEKMDDAHVVLLLNHTLNQASDSRASLAIAHLAPTRLEDPAIREMMFNTLADQNLGAAAALVLSASPDPEIQSRLREIASEKDGLAQHRAALALSVRRAGGGAEQ